MKNNLEIIPAILPRDFAEIEEKVGQITKVARHVQIDICDGRFVPSITWPFEGDNGQFEDLLSEKEGLPHWQKIDYEFDLMIESPEKEIERWVNSGATRLVIHYASTDDPSRVLALIKERVEIGVAIKNNDNTDILEPLIEHIDFVQIMGIDRIGYQHQAFSPKTVDMTAKVRALYPELPISIDGGVSVENALPLLEAGAMRLVAGSAIFGQENILSAYNELEKMMHDSKKRL